MIVIGKDGTVGFENDTDRKYLQRHSGRWSVISTVPRLLLLERAEGDGKDGKARTLFTGSVERPGWLIEIINFITNSRLSGDLIVVSKNIQRELIFEKGALRVAFSTAQTDLLGEFILSEGILSKEQLERALKAQRSDRRLGQVLVDMGFLNPAEVYQILQRKSERIFYDTIAVGEGVFHFLTDFGRLKLPGSMIMDTQMLLMEGVKRIDDLEFYSQTIPRRAPRLAAAPGPLDGFADQERYFLEAIDGRRTIADIDSGMHLGVDEMLGLTHRMVTKGLIEVMSARELEDQTLRAVVASFNTALDTIYGTVADCMKPEELARIGADFIRDGAHNNKALRKVVLSPDGHLDLQNIRVVFQESTERDKIKLIVMVLTQYISFILFNAIEHLPVDRQETLSSRVNETLTEIFASNL